MDQNIWFLNCKNGTINLNTGKLRKHKKEDLITKIAPVRYKSDANFELWNKFLEDIIPETDVRNFIKRAAGYSMTGYIDDLRIFFAYGPPATGKSTFLAAIKETLGDYASITNFETFLKNKNSGGPKPELASLAGKRFVASNEIDDGRKLAEALVNTLTGGDTVKARFLYNDTFEFIPVMKMWLAANNKPRISSEKSAIWRRLHLLPFNKKIPPKKRDPEVKRKLRNPNIAGSTILNWLIEGCLEYQDIGLNPPTAVKEITEEYRQESDPLKDFFDSCCIITPNAKAKNKDLWNAYENYCEYSNIRFPYKRNNFFKKLSEKGFKTSKSGSTRYRKGIGLKEKLPFKNL
ncbi:MAG: DNA primase family protein [Candidatus Woesearchaeota archaeon]